ncbi:MAG: hypothetical protein RRA35_06235, partial [Desulfomonilia bacterium]|nr:hypothetical protein [Desulfomonilia bacterium]
MRRLSFCSITFLALLLLTMSGAISGCGIGETGGSSGSGRDPYPSQDVSGVWLGYFIPLDEQKKSLFSVGILTTEDGELFMGRFIGDDRQFITSEDLPLKQVEGTAIFQGMLEDCSWYSSGAGDYSSFSDSLLVSAPSSTKNFIGFPLPFIGGGYYEYVSREERGVLTFIYNTSADVTPDVNNIAGRWRFENTQYAGNTMA